MKCKNICENLYEYIYGELDNKRAQTVKTHLEDCNQCRCAYQELKSLLVDTAQPLVGLSKRMEIPGDLVARVRTIVNAGSRNPGRKRKPLRYLTAACLALVLFYTLPVFAYYAIQIFPVEKYAGFIDKAMIKDFVEGRGQVIGKSSSMNGVILTVDGMLKRGGKFSILFTVKVPKTGSYNYGLPASGVNVISVSDQFGKRYIIGSASGTTGKALEEGESQYIFDIDEPLSFWSYKLKVRITAIELGLTNEKENRYFEKYKNIYGDWNVDFYVDRSGNWR